MIQSDVLIIGAGPGGSEAAYRLSEAGLRVVVLEKFSLDREKACGGAIQTGELLEFGPPPTNVVERVIKSSRVFGPRGSFLEISTVHGNESGITVKRSRYDRWLQQRAEKAQFIDNANIASLMYNNGKWLAVINTPVGDTGVESALLIHAAGANASLLDVKLGLPPHSLDGLGITCQFWLDAGKDKLDSAFGNSIEFHFIPDRIPGGYFWLFPKRGILVAGVGTTLDVVREKRLSLKKELADFLGENLERLKLEPSISRIRQDGGKMPMKFRKPLFGNGFLVIGDAAGVGSIIHGGGIYQARKSALFAADSALEFLEGKKNALSEYQDRVLEYFTEHERRWDSRLKPFLTETDLVSLLLERGNTDQSVRDGLGILLSSTQIHRKSYELIEAASFGLIAGELDEIIKEEREVIDKELRKLFPDKSQLHQMINEVLLQGGKRLRAVLVLLVGQALGAWLEELLPVAMAYEVSHTASLIHDDIIDGGEWRRGARTLHRKYGVGHAITAGDALIIKGFEMMADYEGRDGIDKSKLVKLINVGCRSGLEASEGEVRDINFSPKEIEQKSVEDYVELIRLKTGALIEAATEAGALISGASSEVSLAMREFGRDLGIAFQIYDDAKDLLAASTVSLKSRFTDIKKGKLTAQLIHTVHAASKDDRDRLLDLLSMGTLDGADEIIELYRRYDALGFNQRLSSKYLLRASKKIAALPPSRYRQKLEGIIRVLGYWTKLAPDTA